MSMLRPLLSALLLVASAFPAAAEPGGSVVAGWPGGGEGRSIADVPMPWLTGIQAGADGTTWLLTNEGLWKHGADRRLVRVAGGRRGKSPHLAGVPAREAGFGTLGIGLAFDAQGRPLIATGDGQGFGALWRIDEAGKLQPAWTGRRGEQLVAAVPAAPDRLWLLVLPASFTERAAWWLAEGGHAPVRRREAANDELDLVLHDTHPPRLPARARLETAAYQGRLVRPRANGLALLDPATGAITAQGDAGRPLLDADALGTGLAVPEYPQNGEPAVALRPGGKPERWDLAALPFSTIYAAARTPAGELLVAGTGRWSGMGMVIARLGADGRKVFENGRRDFPLDRPTRMALVPERLAIRGKDELICYDQPRNRLLRLRPGQPAEPLTATWPAPQRAADGTAAAVGTPGTAIATDGAGRIYFLHEGLSRFQPGGRLERLCPPPANNMFRQLAVAKDGTAYLTQYDDAAGKHRPVLRVAPGGKPVALPAGTAGASAIAVEPSGALAMLLPVASSDTRVRLARWRPGHALETLATVDRGRPFVTGQDIGSVQELAVDPAGRWWLLDGPRDPERRPGEGLFGAIQALASEPAFVGLARFDPARKQLVPLIGDGRKHLGGGTYDESLATLRGFAFSPRGDLYIADDRSIKRVPDIGR